MSYWTHICATLYVDTHIEDKKIKSKVTKMLKGAPKITGSEDPASIFVNVMPGHNTSTDQDCKVCPYEKTLVEKEDGWYCDAEDDFRCPCTDYQTRVVITIVGDLRDRRLSRTRKEWNEFLDFVQNKICGEHGFTICERASSITGF